MLCRGFLLGVEKDGEFLSKVQLRFLLWGTHGSFWLVLSMSR